MCLNLHNRMTILLLGPDMKSSLVGIICLEIDRTVRGGTSTSERRRTDDSLLYLLVDMMPMLTVQVAQPADSRSLQLSSAIRAGDTVAGLSDPSNQDPWGELNGLAFVSHFGNFHILYRNRNGI